MSEEEISYLSERQAKVYKILSSQFTKTSADVAQKLGIGDSTAAAILSNLRALGVAESKPSNEHPKKFVWRRHPLDNPLNPPQPPQQRRSSCSSLVGVVKAKPEGGCKDCDYDVDAIIDELLDGMIRLKEAVKRQCMPESLVVEMRKYVGGEE